MRFSRPCYSTGERTGQGTDPHGCRSTVEGAAVGVQAAALIRHVWGQIRLHHVEPGFQMRCQLPATCAQIPKSRPTGGGDKRQQSDERARFALILLGRRHQRPPVSQFIVKRHAAALGHIARSLKVQVRTDRLAAMALQLRPEARSPASGSRPAACRGGCDRPPTSFPYR